MKFRVIRNATAVVTLGPHRILVDPMLGGRASMMGFRPFGGRRNPLVELPAGTDEALAPVTAAIVTHPHPDHLDRAGVAWLRERKLPVFTSADEVAGLRGKGLEAQVLAAGGALGLTRVETIATAHGYGIIGWAMGRVRGFYLEYPGEPSLYLIGDSVMTDAVRDAITTLKPDVIVAPAGSANFGIGRDILFSRAELDELAALARGSTLILNHLEALDHCPTKREDVRPLGLVPADGEEIEVLPAPKTNAARATPTALHASAY